MQKKNIRRILCLVLAASLTFAVSGCGTKTSEDPVPTGQASVESSADDDMAATGPIWSFLDEETAALSKDFDVSNMKCVRLIVVGSSESIYNTTDPEIIEKVYKALDKVSVTGLTTEQTPNADQTFTFIDNDGKEYSIKFNDNNLVGKDGIYLIIGDEDLWDAAINLRENATESYTESADGEGSGDSVSGDPEDPMNGRADNASKTASHFSYKQESSGDGTEFIFGDALVITLPPDWDGKWAMEQGNDYVTFYHTDSHEAWMEYDGSDGGVLFGIYYSKDKEDSENAEYVGLARDGGYYYFSFPSDMQAYMDDESIVEDYASLAEEVDSIAANAFSTISE
jgi:hypothetical protein